MKLTTRRAVVRKMSAAAGACAAVTMGAITACGTSGDSEPTISQQPVSVSPVEETMSSPISVAPNETATSQNPPTGVESGDATTPRTPTGDVDPPGGPPGLPGGDS